MKKANILNNLFTNIGKQLAQKYDHINTDDKSYIERVTPTLMEINDVKNKLEQSIVKLKPGKAAGLDGITTREVKNTVAVFKRINLKSLCQKLSN